MRVQFCPSVWTVLAGVGPMGVLDHLCRGGLAKHHAADPATNKGDAQHDRTGDRAKT